MPWSEVVGWQGRCSCGWAGLARTLVADPAAEDWDARRAHTESKYRDAPERVDDAVYVEW